VPLLDAIRAVTAFAPPRDFPECDPALLADVLEAHGLAPLASYQLEHHPIGAGAPEALRERLLTSYQGVVNDNLLKLTGLRAALRAVEGLRLVLLEAAAYVDWIYPHLAFRPAGDLRAAVSADDVQRIAAGGALRVGQMSAGQPAHLTDGRIAIVVQEGLWPGAPPDVPLFQRATPHRVFGPSAYRPAPEEAILATVAEQALTGLHAPLVTYLDLRELVALELDVEHLRAHAAALGLSRALHGAMLLTGHYFPDAADAAARLRPRLGVAERVAVERVVEAAKDPARLRQVRGVDAAARLVVAP
jgi:hypothetical protein